MSYQITPIATSSAGVQGSPYVPASPVSNNSVDFLLNEAQASRPAPEQAPVLGKGIAATMQTADAGKKEVLDAEELDKAKKFEDVLNQGLPLAKQMYDEAKGKGITLPDPSIYYAAGPEKAAAWLTNAAEKISGAKAADAIDKGNLPGAVSETLRGGNPKEAAPLLDVLKPTANANALKDATQRDYLIALSSERDKHTESPMTADQVATFTQKYDVDHGTNVLNSDVYKTVAEGADKGFSVGKDVTTNVAKFNQDTEKLRPTIRALINIDKDSGGKISKSNPTAKDNLFDQNQVTMISSTLNTVDNPSVGAAIVNWALKKMGVPFSNTLSPEESKKQQTAIEQMSKSGELDRIFNDPKFQKTSQNLYQLINATIKQNAGTAVSGSEMTRAMQQFGLGARATPFSVSNAIRTSYRDALGEFGSMQSQLLPDAADKVRKAYNYPDRWWNEVQKPFAPVEEEQASGDITLPTSIPEVPASMLKHSTPKPASTGKTFKSKSGSTSITFH